MSEAPRKRAAIEPAAALFDRNAEPAPPRRRPFAVTGGAVLVVTRAAGTALWSLSALREWGSIRSDLDLSHDDARLALGALLGFQALWLLLLLTLAWLVWRGGNGARILVMLGTTASIVVAAVSYFAAGQEITIRTTLLTLALDILILLALSSRDARAWTRPRARSG